MKQHITAMQQRIDDSRRLIAATNQRYTERLGGNTWVVTGIIQICIRSRWTKAGIRVEVQALDRQAAIDAVLARYQRAAEQQDPHATVCWHTPELVRAERGA